MTRAIRKKSGTGVKTNWHFVWSCSEIDKMITRTDPMIDSSKTKAMVKSLTGSDATEDSNGGTTDSGNNGSTENGGSQNQGGGSNTGGGDLGQN